MKRKSIAPIALLLALIMCLILLSACGADGTPETPETPSIESTAQPTTDGKEEQSAQESEQEKSEEDEQEETEEPTQEEVEEENNAGKEFLALLQEEWNNGFVEGEGPNHTFYDSHNGWSGQAFIRDGVVYLADVKGYGDCWYCSYDIASKEFHESSFSLDIWYDNSSRYFVDDNFYLFYRTFGYAESEYTLEIRMYDYNGVLLNSYPYANYYFPFEKGILAICTPYNNNADALLSYSFEKIADIPVPQVEIEHGLKEEVVFEYPWFAAEGTVYTRAYGNGAYYLYRLNTDTYEWENLGEMDSSYSDFSAFCGRYISCYDGIYDCITGERVFEYGELYHAVEYYDGLCYFGDDKYLGKNGKEYRWVNLTDLSMSDPLPFPEGKSVTVLDDTYCVYSDQYGWFLWNYNTGAEETIVIFDN